MSVFLLLVSGFDDRGDMELHLEEAGDLEGNRGGLAGIFDQEIAMGRIGVRLLGIVLRIAIADCEGMRAERERQSDFFAHLDAGRYLAVDRDFGRAILAHAAFFFKDDFCQNSILLNRRAAMDADIRLVADHLTAFGAFNESHRLSP
jgi:hypothetical protein